MTREMTALTDLIGKGQVERLKQFEDDFNCITGLNIAGRWFILTYDGEYIDFDSFDALRAEIERLGEEW